MASTYTVLLSELASEFKLDFFYRSTDFDKIHVTVDDISRPGLHLAGFFDHYEPMRVYVCGTVETAYRWNGRRTQGDTNSYGNMLKLRHADYRGGRLETLYAHLSKLCVAQGETVYEGQLIGYSGDTGNCYGAHLHFEVRYKNRRVHPLNWLDADFAAASTAVRLGGYQSVARPAAEKTQPVQMQTVTVGPISNGDAARLYALCGDLGLVESGLYHAAYTEV